MKGTITLTKAEFSELLSYKLGSNVNITNVYFFTTEDEVEIMFQPNDRRPKAEVTSAVDEPVDEAWR